MEAINKMTNNNQGERREQERDIALYNLKSSGLSGLATAYLSQLKDGGFGENDQRAVEQYLYVNNFNSAASGNLGYRDPETGEETQLAGSSAEDIMRSREEGRRYSGRAEISEYRTIQKAAAIIQNALTKVKVKDVMELIGSDVQVDEKYKNKYVGDLLESENDEDKVLARNLVGGYQEYITTKGVAGALSRTADATKGGLEQLVSGRNDQERQQLRVIRGRNMEEMPREVPDQYRFEELELAA